MDIKIKCTQCGCDDLVEVDFPYKSELVEVSTGIYGESFVYDLDETIFAKTYICTRCGHFEFFNPELAKIVIDEREEKASIQAEIDKLDKQILSNNDEIETIKKSISSTAHQLEDLDITIRQSNELKEKKKGFEQKLKELEASNKLLIKQKNKLSTDLDS